MRPPIPPDVESLVASLRLPERFSGPLMSYVAKLISYLEPDCIVLYGSLAKRTYTAASDIDLVVIASQLPEGFGQRISLLQELNDTACPIDAFGYTPEEFLGMLKRGHVTALDALADGVPVYGDRSFGRLTEVFQDMVQRGLRRSICSWVLPGPVQSG